MNEMYADIILDYYRNPRNYGSIKNADISVRDTNPLCGDDVEITIKLDSDRIQDIRFSGKGCAISQAAASMLTEVAMGKKLQDVAKLEKKDILEMLAIPISPVRLKCALLSLKVLKLGIYSHMGRSSDELRNLLSIA